MADGLRQRGDIHTSKRIAFALVVLFHFSLISLGFWQYIFLSLTVDDITGFKFSLSEEWYLRSLVLFKVDKLGIIEQGGFKEIMGSSRSF